MITLSSASTSASTCGGRFEVFLNFKGDDTRKGFTDFLYTYLVSASIHTFRDDNSLRVGEKISLDLLKAIKDSKISIPIFSKNYAASKWCLLELSKMVECQENEGQQIFPIFYDVDPFDVRNQKGSYEKAFRQHMKNFDEKTVQEWKEVLGKVGALKGFELKKETDGCEGELVKMIVERVLLELKKNYTHVPDNLVEVDDIEKVKQLLDVNSGSVRIVGIYGMGGIGKTTIAKVIYNQLCERFESCCFLEDVGENSRHRNGLVNLQNELISKILKGKFSNSVNVDEGINRIRDVIHNKKVLIVLDDVDEQSQLHKLLVKCDWFGEGSRIIVTTRDKGVLDVLEASYHNTGPLEVSWRYEPQMMDPDHSLRVFSKYAFMRDLPPEDYAILSRRVVVIASGLPLVLVTIGSLLFGNKVKASWEEILRKLGKIPHKKVQEKLRISYDALDYGQKQIFLDIACLFIGEDKTYPCYMWDDCDFYPLDGINVLVCKSLLKVGDDNRFRMHDQLRDLGRQIVREANLNDPWNRSRFWCREESLEMLQRHMGTNNVEALYLGLEKYVELGPRYRFHCLVGEDFWQLQNLRFLKVGYALIDGDFKHVLSNLRWLEWNTCPGNMSPKNLCLKNLVILNLSGSFIEDDWDVWSEIKMAKKLKVLDLSRTRLRRAHHLSNFTTLERLFLSECESLEEIEPLDRNLINLRVIDLSNCWSLRTLDCSKFANLESLDVHDCMKLHSLDGLGQLELLRYLNASDCYSLKILPDLSNIKMLKELKIMRCMRLTEIRGLGGLKSLTYLNMVGCRSIETLHDLSKLRMLKELNLLCCIKLREVECVRVLESLESLNLSWCHSLEKIPDLSTLKNLKELRICGIMDSTKITGFEEVTSLELLSISESESLEKLPDLSKLQNLKELYVSDCLKLTDIGGLMELKSLTVVDLSRCELIEKLDLLYLRKLRGPSVFDCVKLTEVRGLENLWN
ncbi:hypothetical protein LguiA_018898 [Lonicera macranthoides]